MKVMLELNKPILVDDPYRLLQYERGVFEVVSPTGLRVRVICPPERPPEAAIASEAARPGHGWWRVEKIA